VSFYLAEVALFKILKNNTFLEQEQEYLTEVVDSSSNSGINSYVLSCHHVYPPPKRLSLDQAIYIFLQKLLGIL
jgi:hypothetical protein